MHYSPSPDSRIQKFGLVKSRHGCTTCKYVLLFVWYIKPFIDINPRSRKVKCDEAQPRCQRCTSTGRKCEYKVPTTGSGYGASSLLSPSLGLSPSKANPSALRERRAFEYYFHRGALSIAGVLDVKFWKDTVLQLSRSEPAIWDAVIAISGLYENSHSSLSPSGSANHEALGWYSRSMASVRNLIRQNKANEEIAIVTCVLYICIEFMQGHTKEALQLYEQGVNLIYELRAASSATFSSRRLFFEDTVIPLFFRMGIAALSTAGTPVVKNPFAFADHQGCSSFFTIEAARAAFAPLIRESILFRWEAGSHILEVRSAANISAGVITRQQSLLSRLDDWCHSFIELAGKEDTNKQPDPMYQSAISTMRTFHAAIYIMLSTCLTQRETAFDAYMEHFRTIVEHASWALASSTAPAPFTFELGVGQPLFFTAVSCRDPFLRREALSLLRRVPQVQGFFQCAPRAACAEQYIKMEEERVSGLMMRVSDMEDHPGQITEDSIENEVKEISTDRLSNLPNVEDLITIENETLPGDEQSPIPEENRIRKLATVHLDSFDGEGSSPRLQRKPFLHLTRNRLNPINRTWEEREYFLPLNSQSMHESRFDNLASGIGID